MVLRKINNQKPSPRLYWIETYVNTEAIRKIEANIPPIKCKNWRFNTETCVGVITFTFKGVDCDEAFLGMDYWISILMRSGFPGKVFLQ